GTAHTTEALWTVPQPHRQHIGTAAGCKEKGPREGTPEPKVETMRRPGGKEAGEGGAGRESGRARARAGLHAAPAGQELRRVERLADRQMHCLRQGASSSGADRADDLAGIRGGAAEARALCGPL